MFIHHSTQSNFFFLGGERGNTPYHPYGSRYAIDTFGIDDAVFAIYIDAKTNPATWTFKVAGNGVTAPLGLTQNLVESARSESLSYQLDSSDMNFNSLGLQENLGSYGTWLDSGIPTVALWGEGTAKPEYYGRQIENTVFTLLDVDRRIGRNLQEQEHIYVYFHPFKNMKPTFYSGTTLCNFHFNLFYPSVDFRILPISGNPGNQAAVCREMVDFTSFISSFVFFLLLSTLLIEEIGYLKDFPTMWKYSMETSLFFKLFTAVALSLNFILVIHGLPFPRAPRFYAHSAVIISNLLTMLFMILNITLVPYTIWITAMLLFFSTSKNIRWKVMYLLLALLPHVTTTFKVLIHSYTSVVHFLLLDRITGNLIVAISIFPYSLGIISLHYCIPHSVGIKQKEALSPIGLISSLLAIVSLIWLVSFDPFSTNQKQPVTIVDKVDTAAHVRFVEVESPAPVGDAEIIQDGISYAITNLGRQSKVRIPYYDDDINIISRSWNFLGRRTIEVELNGEIKPHQIIMAIRSLKLFTLHSASMPFEMAPSGQEAKIFIGG